MDEEEEQVAVNIDREDNIAIRNDYIPWRILLVIVILLKMIW